MTVTVGVALAVGGTVGVAVAVGVTLGVAVAVGVGVGVAGTSPSTHNWIPSYF